MANPSTTIVDVWNRALSRVGQTTEIQSVDDDSTVAGVCRTHWGDILRQLLGAWPWPFARKQAALSAPSGVTRTGWDYVYNLPSDCLRPLVLLDEDERYESLPVASRKSFELQQNDDGDALLLCTNYEAAEDFEVLEYTAYTEAVYLMPFEFVDALAWYLAGELADAVVKTPQLAEYCRSHGEAALAAARAFCLNAKQNEAEPTTPSVSARG
jgi:hypothetical protein